jgi:hypothetical protein
MIRCALRTIVRQELSKTLVAQEDVLEQLMTGLLAKGRCLFETRFVLNRFQSVWAQPFVWPIPLDVQDDNTGCCGADCRGRDYRWSRLRWDRLHL